SRTHTAGSAVMALPPPCGVQVTVYFHGPPIFVAELERIGLLSPAFRSYSPSPVFRRLFESVTNGPLISPSGLNSILMAAGSLVCHINSRVAAKHTYSGVTMTLVLSWLSESLTRPP